MNIQITILENEESKLYQFNKKELRLIRLSDKPVLFDKLIFRMLGSKNKKYSLS